MLKKEFKLCEFKFRPVWLIIIGAIITGLIVSWVLFWAVVAPVISAFFIPHNGIYTDLILYTQGEYQEFEDSEKLDTFVNSFAFTKSAQPISFYFVDNRREDNPIYGKRSDVFSVDFKLEQSDYMETKAVLAQAANHMYDKGKFSLFITPKDLGHRNCGILAFNDTDCVIRCIVVTYLEEVEGRTTAQGIKSVLENKTNLPFE